MTWTAIVPIKEPERRKLRLAGLDPGLKIALTDRWFAHVHALLSGHPAIGEILVLSPVPKCGESWLPDRGRGLNAELSAARRDLAEHDIIVLFPDLPLLDADDLTALAQAAGETGAAAASDRHAKGTNALALHSTAPIQFAFGTDSCRLHRDQGCTIVDRPGLAIDVDTPQDLELVERALAPSTSDRRASRPADQLTPRTRRG